MINVVLILINKWPEKENYVHVYFSLTFVCRGRKNVKGIDESLSSIFPGPQSPCERTDLRMAIVADHLGLSWTGENIQHCFVLSQAPSTSLSVFGSIYINPCYLLPSSGKQHTLPISYAVITQPLKGRANDHLIMT